MNIQQAKDRHLLEYCDKKIEQIEDEIYKKQLQLEFYREVRDMIYEQMPYTLGEDAE